MAMKVCLLSFDSVYFDHHIVNELKRRYIDANHIDISKIKYKYPSFFSKIGNFFSKLLLKKNVKHAKIEIKLLQEIEQLGHQDIILMIRPDRISRATHLEIKKLSNRYISYIYDSCVRFPIDHLLQGVFDEIFSFDLVDSKKYGFTFITNYIYLDKKEIQPFNENNDAVFIIMSIDERFKILNKLANYFSANNINFKFILVSKRKPKNSNERIIFYKKTLLYSDFKNDLENSKVCLDLIRFNHNGLSFRIFEALAMQKKIITTNKSIVEYDFYNPNNIMVIDENNLVIDNNFFKTSYEPLHEDVYEKYTIKNWVTRVFFS
jgi:hypothetical protein